MIEARDGALEGRPVFVLGGGPSLGRLNLSLLEELGVPRLALNMAFLKGADAVLMCDSQVRRELIEKNGALLSAWKSFTGPKWLARFEQEAVKPEDVPDMTMLPAPRRWCDSLAEGVLCRSNAGLAALNLCDILGAGTVYLLGYDMTVPPPSEKDKELARKMRAAAAVATTPNWHELYPHEWKSGAAPVFADMLEAFREWAPSVRSRVVNCNPSSALRVFPFMEYEAAVLEAKDAMDAWKLARASKS